MDVVDRQDWSRREDKMVSRGQNQVVRTLRRRGGITFFGHDFVKMTSVVLGFVLFVAGVNALKLLSLGVQFDAYTYFCILAGQVVLILSLFLYIANSRKELVFGTKKLIAVCICMTISYALNIFLLPLSPYWMPVALSAFLVAPLVRKRDVFVINLFSVAMVLFNTVFVGLQGAGYAGSLTRTELVQFLAMCLSGILAGSFLAYRVYITTKRFSYVLRGLFYGAIAFGIVFVVLLLYRYDNQFNFWQNIGGATYKILVATIGSIVAGLLLHPILEFAFNLVTNTRLVELSDHSNPLIKRLMEEAPGTFNHSMAVANFAEVCAKAIGENPYMARAAAYYHDMGKLINPRFFKENQGDINPHDELLPEQSAEIIRNHAKDGVEMALRAHVPREVAEVAEQHHGTLHIAVFYHKAKQLTDREVDIKEYSYSGQTPKTKIAAIIMICDASEAAIRAMPNPDGEKVNELLKKIIEQRITSGQFADCDITMRDLDTIRNTIINIYGGVFHQRVAYPDGKSAR
ncbi:MAG: HDIG domain-containing protein [Firmicutes bacterium]|nr:HDIG domain-containing protein [Bacillota bacterium]